MLGGAAVVDGPALGDRLDRRPHRRNAQRLRQSGNDITYTSPVGFIRAVRETAAVRDNAGSSRRTASTAAPETSGVESSALLDVRVIRAFRHREKPLACPVHDQRPRCRNQDEAALNKSSLPRPPVEHLSPDPWRPLSLCCQMTDVRWDPPWSDRLPSFVRRRMLFDATSNIHMSVVDAGDVPDGVITRAPSGELGGSRIAGVHR